jgi:peptidylprolyl isomerase
MMRERQPKLILLSLLCAILLSAPVLAQDKLLWRQLDPANTVYMQIGEGQVIFELNPVFAPKTTEQFRDLLKEKFYRSLSFYRVIDGFVAQGGDESDIDVPNSQPRLEAEFEKEKSEEIQWTSVQHNDLFAPETGFIDGFAAARDEKHFWLTHCPGALAMARGNEPDSGSTDFYIVIGQSPRYLDRNLTIFGRVVHGMEVVQRIHRGKTEDNGIIEGDEDRSRIKSMVLGTDIPPAERKEVYVMDTNSPGFKTYLEARRIRTDDFFHHKPPSVLDVCQVPVASRIEKTAIVLP